MANGIYCLSLDSTEFETVVSSSSYLSYFVSFVSEIKFEEDSIGQQQLKIVKGFFQEQHWIVIISIIVLYK